MIVHESRTAGEPDTHALVSDLYCLGSPRNRVSGKRLMSGFIVWDLNGCLA